MKKTAWIALALSAAMLFTACGSEGYVEDDDDDDKPKKEEQTSQTDPTGETDNTSVVVWPSDTLARQCMDWILKAETEENAKLCLTEDCHDRAAQLIDYYPNEEYTLNMGFKAKFNEYDIYYYDVHYSGELFESGYALLLRDTDRYKLCANKEVQQGLVDAYGCPTCNATGQISTGAPTTCAICGGTGSQYYPNMYYDSTLNMWMGQHMACSGCGGSGQTGGAASAVCSTCNGSILIFPGDTHPEEDDSFHR